MIVDMSPRAITTRLKRVAQLRDAYLRLQRGKLVAREEPSEAENASASEPPRSAAAPKAR